VDTNQLKYFITTAQTLNFSEAARRVGLAQSTMSHTINELEKQLGCQLFIRNRRNVSLTEAGRKLLPYAIEMVELADKAAFHVREFEEGRGGHISIAALTTSSEALSLCLSEFSTKYPDITVDITFNSGRTQVVEMNESRYDFHFAVKEMVPVGESFNYINTHKDRLCMALHKKHPLAGKPLDFAALTNERFIAVSESDGPTLYNHIMSICKARGYKPHVTLQYDRAEAVLLSVGAGLGISIIPEALTKVFYSKNVCVIPIEGSDTLRQYVMAWHSDMTNPAGKLFLGIARRLFGEQN
jgi:DNA-binding transcriptional LysR family regulator